MQGKVKGKNNDRFDLLIFHYIANELTQALLYTCVLAYVYEYKIL